MQTEKLRVYSTYTRKIDFKTNTALRNKKDDCYKNKW